MKKCKEFLINLLKAAGNNLNKGWLIAGFLFYKNIFKLLQNIILCGKLLLSNKFKNEIYSNNRKLVK